jgi:hypothetical protein
MDLSICIPADKHDQTAVERAAALGFPTINPILPDLLEWLQDINWPVAPVVADLLAKAGVEIAPHINAVLKGDDGVWKYWILTSLAEHLHRDVWTLIEADVERLSRSPTDRDRDEEVDIAAGEVLALRSGNNGSTSA